MKIADISLTQPLFKILVTKERARLWNKITKKLHQLFDEELLCSVSPTQIIIRTGKTNRLGSTLTLDLRCAQQISAITNTAKKILKKGMPGHTSDKGCKPTGQVEPKLKMIKLIESDKKYEDTAMTWINKLMSQITSSSESKLDYHAVLRSTAAAPGFEDHHGHFILQLSFSDPRTQDDICNKLIQEGLLAYRKYSKLKPESVKKSDFDKKNYFILVYLKKEKVRRLCSSNTISQAGIANSMASNKQPAMLANQFKRIKLTANDRVEGKFLCKWLHSLIQQEPDLNTANYNITARSAKPDTEADGEESTKSLPRTLILEVKATSSETLLSLGNLLDEAQYTTRRMKTSTPKGSQADYYLLTYINQEKLRELHDSDQSKKQPAL